MPIPQEERPGMGKQTVLISIREFLVGVFERARVPYAIGPGIDGDLLCSPTALHLGLPQALKLAALAVDYVMEHMVTDGIHVIRRVPNEAIPPVPAVALQAQITVLELELTELRKTTPRSQ